MCKKQFAIVLVVSFFGGIIGGLISGKMFTGNDAYAKNKATPQIIEAREYRVVDDSGKVLGKFSSNGIQIDEKSGSGSTSVTLNSMGLEVSSHFPGYWKYEAITTTIMSSGFTYREFSKLDKIEIEKNFFGEGLTPFYNIVIGENHTKAPGPAIQLYDRQKNLRVALGATELQDKISDSVIQRPVSSLVLFNDKGKVIQEIP